MIDLDELKRKQELEFALAQLSNSVEEVLDDENLSVMTLDCMGETKVFIRAKNKMVDEDFIDLDTAEKVVRHFPRHGKLDCGRPEILSLPFVVTINNPMNKESFTTFEYVCGKSVIVFSIKTEALGEFVYKSTRRMSDIEYESYANRLSPTRTKFRRGTYLPCWVFNHQNKIRYQGGNCRLLDEDEILAIEKYLFG